MEQFSDQLYAEMKERLQQHVIDSESLLQRARMSLQISGAFLQRLKGFIVGYSFKDAAEEIRFFKVIKPRFLKEHIFYTRIYQIEAGRPVGSKELIKSYYHKVLDNISSFFENNNRVYEYYRTERTDNDHLMFIRNAEQGLFHLDYSLDIDNRFSTVYSQKLARIQAFEDVVDYILEQFETLENGKQVKAADGQLSNLVWTDSNAALIEVVYAIYCRGSVNHGNANMKQIIKVVETTFNVRLGNFYSTIKSMRSRKKVRTPFLITLIESAERGMDETDMDS